MSPFPTCRPGTKVRLARVDCLVASLHPAQQEELAQFPQCQSVGEGAEHQEGDDVARQAGHAARPVTQGMTDPTDLSETANGPQSVRRIQFAPAGSGSISRDRGPVSADQSGWREL